MDLWYRSVWFDFHSRSTDSKLRELTAEASHVPCSISVMDTQCKVLQLCTKLLDTTSLQLFDPHWGYIIQGEMYTVIPVKTCMIFNLSFHLEFMHFPKDSNTEPGVSFLWYFLLYHLHHHVPFERSRRYLANLLQAALTSTQN